MHKQHGIMLTWLIARGMAFSHVRASTSMFCGTTNTSAQRHFNVATSKHTAVPSRGVKRFFQNVSVEKVNSNEWGVSLDGRLLSVPSGAKLFLPTQKCAELIVKEWEYQKDVLRFETMPISSLAIQAIDLIGQDRPGVEAATLKFLKTDATLFQVAGIQSKFATHVGHIHEAIRETFGLQHPLSISNTLKAPQQHTADLDILASVVREQTPWGLSSLFCLTRNLKSYLLGVAVLHDLVSVEDAIKAANFEENLQKEKWGILEDHEIEESTIIMWLNSAKTLQSATRF